MATDDRLKLLTLLATFAYQHKPEGFALTSGKISTEYIDCKMALSHADCLPSLGAVFVAHVSPVAEAIGGLTMGADPIAIATSLVSAGGRNLRWFSVRKEPKKHGLRKLIEGDVPNGAKVVIVDDVVTTGGSTIDAIRKARTEALDVVQVLVLVDREEEDGIDRVRAEAGPAVSVVSMFKKSEVREQWEAQEAQKRSMLRNPRG